jgi:hypothetical protein
MRHRTRLGLRAYHKVTTEREFDYFHWDYETWSYRERLVRRRRVVSRRLSRVAAIARPDHALPEHLGKKI